eukprot:Amastigsp_a340305_166.p3 type:complete len:161 gc:universal Amastigsp_a340305_166:966-484(-)
MISEKNDLVAGSSGSSKVLACASQIAAARMSAILIVPFDDEYMNVEHESGWNSAEVITSVSSSMFSGLMSTIVNDWFEISRFHKLIRRSSAEMNVSPSEFTEIELMWYACAFANTRRGVAATTFSVVSSRGSLMAVNDDASELSRRPSRFVAVTIWIFFS